MRVKRWSWTLLLGLLFATAWDHEAQTPVQESVVRVTFKGLSCLVAPRADGNFEKPVHVVIPKIGGQAPQGVPQDLWVSTAHRTVLRYCPPSGSCEEWELTSHDVSFVGDLVEPGVVSLHHADLGTLTSPPCYPGSLGCTAETAISLQWLPDLDRLAERTLGSGARFDGSVIDEEKPRALAGRFTIPSGDVFVSGFWPGTVGFGTNGTIAVNEQSALPSSFSVDLRYRNKLKIQLDDWSGGSEEIELARHPFLEIVVDNFPAHEVSMATEDLVNHFRAHYLLWKPPTESTVSASGMKPHVPFPVGETGPFGNPQCSPGQGGG